MKPLSADINLDEEVAHLAEFISLKWTPIPNIHAVFTEIRNAALHQARGWLDDHKVWELAIALQDKREALLKAHLPEAEGDYAGLYDALCTLLHDISREVKSVGEAGLALDGNWDYERRVRSVKASLATARPELFSARPLGWDELAKKYNDFDGQEEYDPRPDRDLFKGSKVEGVLSGDFTYRVALPYVMYDEKCQCRKAATVLIGSVFSHFLGIAAFLNTEKLKQALVAGLPQLDVPAMLFERNLSTDNPFLKVLFELAKPCQPKSAFDEALAQKIAYMALSDEEKAQRSAEAEADLSAFFAELKKRSPSFDMEERNQERDLRVSLLKAAFDQM